MSIKLGYISRHSSLSMYSSTMAIVFVFLVIIPVFTSTESLEWPFIRTRAHTLIRGIDEDENSEQYDDYNGRKGYVKQEYRLGIRERLTIIEIVVSFLYTIFKPLKYSFTSVNRFMRSRVFCLPECLTISTLALTSTRGVETCVNLAPDLNESDFFLF